MARPKGIRESLKLKLQCKVIFTKGSDLLQEPTVDHELCIGCGVCAEFCPEVFEIRDDKSWVIGPDKCDTCDCGEAIASCPVEAIEMVENDN